MLIVQQGNAKDDELRNDHKKRSGIAHDGQNLLLNKKIITTTSILCTCHCCFAQGQSFGTQSFNQKSAFNDSSSELLSLGLDFRLIAGPPHDSPCVLIRIDPWKKSKMLLCSYRANFDWVLRPRKKHVAIITSTARSLIYNATLTARSFTYNAISYMFCAVIPKDAPSDFPSYTTFWGFSVSFYGITL